jgi:hypothetical protein
MKRYLSNISRDIKRENGSQNPKIKLTVIDRKNNDKFFCLMRPQKQAKYFIGLNLSEFFF